MVRHRDVSGCQESASRAIMKSEPRKGKEPAKRHTANGRQCSDFLPMLFLLLLRHEKEI